MLQTLANTMENERFELKTVANTMENERFELKTVANTMEMALSSSKMLQIAWEMVRTGNQKKIPQTKKKKSPNNFLPFRFQSPFLVPVEEASQHGQGHLLGPAIRLPGGDADWQPPLLELQAVGINHHTVSIFVSSCHCLWCDRSSMKERDILLASSMKTQNISTK